MRILLFATLFLFSASMSFAQYMEEGEASYYSDDLVGKATASGEPYNAKIFTAAHKTHPFGTKVIVKNKKNGQSVIVRINDRGPFVEGRVIDLSKAAAQYIGLVGVGVAPVSLRILDEAMLDDGNGNITTTTTTTAPPVTSTPPASTPPPTTTPPSVEPPTVITSVPSTGTSTPDLPPVITSTPSDGQPRTPIINSKTIGANFAVQLGSYRDFENVGIELAKFKNYSFSNELNIYETWKDGKKLFRILVGPYHTREEAAEKSKSIKSEGLDCFVFNVR